MMVSGQESVRSELMVDESGKELDLEVQYFSLKFMVNYCNHI